MASKPIAKKYAAANAAAGGEPFIEMGSFTPYANSGVVLTFDGTTWSLIRMARKSCFNYAVTDAQGNVFVGESKGRIFCFSQPDAGVSVAEVGSDGRIEGVMVFDGKTVFSAYNTLYSFGANGPEGFEPTLPLPEGEYFEWLVTSERRLYVCLAATILYLEDGQWHTLEIPPELAVMGKG